MLDTAHRALEVPDFSNLKPSKTPDTMQQRLRVSYGMTLSVYISDMNVMVVEAIPSGVGACKTSIECGAILYVNVHMCMLRWGLKAL